jgi:hypothetical protein
MSINYFALIVASVAAFIASSIWYVAFNEQRQRLLGTAPEAARRRPGWKVVVELARNVVIAAGVAVLLAMLGVAQATGALTLAAALWVAFPVMILLGSVMWENAPPPLAAIHSGDWLIKLILMSLVLTLWR